MHMFVCVPFFLKPPLSLHLPSWKPHKPRSLLFLVQTPNSFRSSKPHLLPPRSPQSWNPLPPSARPQACMYALGWISSWFARERKKNGTIVRRSAKVRTTAMSLEEITAFKAENHDTALPMITNTSLDTGTEQKPVLLTPGTKDTVRKPRRKRDNDSNSRPDATAASKADSSSLRSPFISVPLLRRSSPQAVSRQDQASNATDFFSSPSVILRGTVPLTLYMPPGSSSTLPLASRPSDSTLVTGSHTMSDLVILPGATSAANLTSTVIPDPDVSVLNYNYDPDAENNVQSTTTERLHGSALRHTEQSDTKKYAQTQIQNRDGNTYRPLRPLLPRYSPPRGQITEPPYQDPSQRLRDPCAQPPLYAHSQVLNNQSTKENHPPPHYPQASVTQAQPPAHKRHVSGLPALKPLFSYANLNLTKSTLPQELLPYSAPPGDLYPPQPHPELHQPLPPPRLQPLPYDQNIDATYPHPSNEPYATLLDPTTTPLKYLDALMAPFTIESLMADETMHQLLDERLAQEDPFQAAMGLVFASRLGLVWDFN
ncbi:hypothetical protein FPV67DRAFT_773911 [Lyophyllum atratum]|nr:hypothetical protein FPV67DRAFT_773911 [Lyophyllum atratum]